MLTKLFRTSTGSSASGPRRVPRSRSNTTTSFRGIEEEESVAELRIPTRSRVPSAQASPRRELSGFDFSTRPVMASRGATFEGPRSLQRDASPALSIPRLSRVPTETSVLSGRSQLRSIKRENSNGNGTDVFGDPEEDALYGSSYERSESPAGFSMSRSTSYQENGNGIRKMPPPPPPSRSKKPPPPPPLKRSALSSSEVPFA